MNAPTITSQTTIAEIVRLLSNRGCPDITNRLDMSKCTLWRVDGGGQGDIHEGTLVDGARVAIKISRGDQSIDISKGDKSFKRAARELYTWFTLSHPNIAKLLGMAVFQGRIAMISPWITPGNFYKFIDGFPEADRMDLCLQVAAGLAYLHANQVVFGDLKAQNVLIGSDGVAKLTDFGLSILEKSQALFSITSTTGGGSARWMAPELFESLTERSFEADVYALAMTFIEILTDTIPFPHINDDMKVMYAVSFRNAVPDRPKRLEVETLRNKDWWLLLSKCWSCQPEMRPKAEAWNVLDRGLAAQRTQQLSEQLAHVLLYGRTTSGPLTNLDTNEVLPPSDATVALFIFTLTREEPGLRTFMQSKEAVLQALIELYSPKSIRRPHRDDAYVKNLQNRIYEQLEKRIHHVRRWIAINVAQFSPRNPDVRNLFAKLDTMALAMKAAGHICSAQCSRCELLCLLGYGHLNGEHDCGNKHPNSASTVNFIGMAGQTRESDKPTFPRSPLDSIGSLNCLSITNISKALITEYTAQRIRVQDLDSMLLELPNKDAANALSIEWQSPCYLPYDSLVLRVDETYWSVHQKTWWIRLVREPGQDFITPHFNPYSVQRPSSAVRAEMKFWYGFSFGHVLQVLYILRDVMQKSCFGMGRETESWFYAAVLFEMLGTEVPNKVVSTVWAEGKRWTYQDHPSVNPVHHKQYRRIRDRVQRLLNPESSFAKQ